MAKNLADGRTFFLPRFFEAGKSCDDFDVTTEISSQRLRLRFAVRISLRGRFASRHGPTPCDSWSESQPHHKGRRDVMELGLQLLWATGDWEHGGPVVSSANNRVEQRDGGGWRRLP